MRRPPKLEWLGLMDVVGPFVTPTIIAEAFPNGLEGHDSSLLKGLRGAYKTWEESDDPIFHREWVNVVLTSVLGYQDKHIQKDQAIPESLSYVDRTHHTTIRPTLIIHQPEFPDRGRLLVIRLPKGEATSKPKAEAKWQASPISQMQMLLQATNEKIGLVTNGEEWVLVNNCGTGAVGFATWYAYLWSEEHDTLRSFRSLIGIRRVFGGEPGQRLVALLTKGSEDQQEVTDRLGYQVRRAVEELVGAFERLDRDSKRELLKSVSETQVYEGVLTVMMRLVFLFCAEERGLLHLGEQLYDDYYAVSTLREQLHDDASKLTEEVLNRRSAAWCRLLATFRMVYQGVEHEDLRIPAYGGTFFDPDRFPWLEGRTVDNTNAPPHVSDRIVLHLLDSLQVLRQGQEARKLSFHALDVEQIGHVYEGLLDHTAKRATKPVLGLLGKEGDEPEVALEALEAKVVEGRDKYFAYLKEQTGKTERALDGLLGQLTDSEKLRRIRVSCGEDHELFERIMPFTNLIREDSFGNVQVYPEGALYATAGSDRRSTGTHYTPKSLCEEVVRYALEPLVYIGPAEGLPEDEWTLKSAKSIVDLKVCDMAMGSGAFLVAACRYLSIKLTEAWALAEEKADRRLGFSTEGHFFTHSTSDDHHAKKPGTIVTTPFGEVAVADPSQELIPIDADERLALARRIVADRCLYGVDRNAMAVEMAKLSLWLTTLRKDRPFTFLDHCLRHGDSLLGVSEQQLEMFSMDSSGQSDALLLPWVPECVEKVRKLRQQIAKIPSHDPEAIRRKQRLFDKVRELERPLKFAADALVACELSEGKAQDRLERRNAIQTTLSEVPSNDRFTNTYPEIYGRPTFHWELEFPEVFANQIASHIKTRNSGFDSIVGNPPFVFGTLASIQLGKPYVDFLRTTMAPWHGKADLCGAFFRRAAENIRPKGNIGMLATASIAKGETCDSSLKPILNGPFSIYRARSSFPWPGDASVTAAAIWISCQEWAGDCILDEELVDRISHGLTDAAVGAEPFPITSSLKAYKGVIVSPFNLKFSAAAYASLTEANVALALAIGGKELYQSWTSSTAPYCIDYERLDNVAREKICRILGSIGSILQLRDSAPAAEMRLQMNRSALSFACAETSHGQLAFTLVRSAWLMTQKTFVVPTNSWHVFAILQSSLFYFWTLQWGIRRKQDLRFSGKRCALTFPRPLLNSSSEWDSIAKEYFEHRERTMELRGWGLTKVYNAFNSPKESSNEIMELRNLHMKLDSMMVRFYGWDIDLDHGFHETMQGIRFTISPGARKEVLRRLLQLNHERYAEEVAAGLHDKKLKKAKAAEKSAEKRARKPKSTPGDSVVRESTLQYDTSGLETSQFDLFVSENSHGDE